MTLGYVKHEVAVAVQAPGAIAVDLAGGPRVAIPGFPHQRGVFRVDAHALDVAPESQGDRARWSGIGEADQQHVVWIGDLVETVERGFGEQRFGVIAHLFLAGQ